MGRIQAGSHIDKTVADTVRHARRFISQAPLALLVPITAALALLTAPLGFLLPLLVWLARDSWRYESELAELYDRDSAELEDLHR